jgi:hypothetical protein
VGSGVRGARGPQDSSRPGVHQAAPLPLGAPEPPPVPQLGAFPASRAGGLLHPLPGRGPPPSPPTRPHASRAALERQDQRQARTAAAPASAVVPLDRGLHRVLSAPAAGREGNPLLAVLRGLPGHTAVPPRITKRKPHSAEPCSAESFPPPSSSRPQVRETPLNPIRPSVPCPGCAPHSHTPDSNPEGPAPLSSETGAEAWARLPSRPPVHSEGVERPHLLCYTGWRGCV